MKTKDIGKPHCAESVQAYGCGSPWCYNERENTAGPQTEVGGKSLSSHSTKNGRAWEVAWLRIPCSGIPWKLCKSHCASWCFEPKWRTKSKSKNIRETKKIAKRHPKVIQNCPREQDAKQHALASCSSSPSKFQKAPKDRAGCRNDQNDIRTKPKWFQDIPREQYAKQHALVSCSSAPIHLQRTQTIFIFFENTQLETEMAVQRYQNSAWRIPNGVPKTLKMNSLNWFLIVGVRLTARNDQTELPENIFSCRHVFSCFFDNGIFCFFTIFTIFNENQWKTMKINANHWKSN